MEHSTAVILAEDSFSVPLREALQKELCTSAITVSMPEQCARAVLEQHAEILVLQVVSPVFCLQDLFHDLQEADCFPLILAFTVSGRNISYYLSAEESFPTQPALETVFCSAFQDYSCREKHIRTTPDPLDTHTYLARSGKDAALMEILRGSTPLECVSLIRDYQLDLKEKGYYLFFWDLQSIEYTAHRLYKEIYNLLGALLAEECRRVLSNANGGEVFYLNLLQLCVIINDLPLKSEHTRRSELNTLLTYLSRVSGCKTAIRYLSGHIEKAADFRDGYESFQNDKSRVFFLRNHHVLRANELEKLSSAPDLTAVNAPLGEITRTIRFDITSSDLPQRIRALYLGPIKERQSFPLFFYCTASIYSELLHIEPSLDTSSMQKNLNINRIQYSSIENVCESLISDILAQAERQRHSFKKNGVLLKALSYIDNNYTRPITLSSVADELYISSVYLSRIFKQELNTTVKQYILQLRIEQAKHLLIETDALISYIAEQVGVPDNRHFCKLFSTHVGDTPSEYRKKYKK